MIMSKSYREDSPVKKLFSLFILTMLCLHAAFSVQTAHAAQQSDYIRLHIIARSDNLHDQAVKLLIRDGIREYAAELLKETSDADEAWQLLGQHEAELLHTAQLTAEQYGFEDEVRIELGVFDFPDRVYGEELVPAGEYRAVRIILGEGEGRNWWCVVYPSLCLPEDADIDKPVEFYSSICRWAKRLWEGIMS